MIMDVERFLELGEAFVKNPNGEHHELKAYLSTVDRGRRDRLEEQLAREIAEERLKSLRCITDDVCQGCGEGCERDFSDGDSVPVIPSGDSLRY